MEETEEPKPKEDSKKTLKDFCKNKWAVATIVLGVLLLITLFTGGITGGAIGVNNAGQITQEYLNDYFKASGIQGDVTINDVKKDSGLYQIEFFVNGEPGGQISLSQDGKYLGQMSLIEPIEQPAQTQQQPANVPKSDKPEVELFVMSFCPYGVEAQKILVPVAKLFGDKIDVRVRFVYYAMHGKTEIDENLMQYCIQEEESGKYWDYIECFVESEDTDSCMSQAKINSQKINSCVQKTDKEFKITEKFNDQSTWLSGRYPLFEVEKEIGDQYGVQGSESLIINGVKISPSQYRWSPNNLKTIICNAFNEIPEECSTNLESGSDGNVQGSCS